MAETLLLEIGTEEIPARFFKGALAQLEEKANAALVEARLGYGDIRAYSTPRRLVLQVTDLADRQRDLEVEAKGPAKKAAYDAEGKPSKAAEGFARGQKVDVADLFVKTDEKGIEYVYARRREEGRPAFEVLPGLLQSLILGLEWPKSMRWADRSIRFVRPIHWLICLYGNEVLPLEIDGIKAGRLTYGHRVLGPKEAIEVGTPAELAEKLQAAYVILDQEKRRELIWQQIQAEGVKHGGYIPKDEELLEEVTHLVEWPTAFTGGFDPSYLEVPAQVLVTSMREHQRYFPIYGAQPGSGGTQAGLLPHFVAVRNGTAEHIDIVRKGNEKVLAARLADARFFYDEDRKETLEDRLPRLETIVFQEKLGTIRQKVDRIGTLADYLVGQMGLSGDEAAAARRAALLCKADLVTHMVYEFTELQGVMGKEYALREGEPAAVAEAIFEHYLPRGADDDLPQSAPGIAVALADKLDTLAGFFGIGMIPSGSADPFALRRAATGVVTILVDSGLPLLLSDLAAAAVRGYGAADSVAAELLKFFEARIRVLMQDRGVRYDVIDAVLAAGYDNPADALLRAEALNERLGDASFATVMGAFRRVANLGAKAEGDVAVSEALFTEEPERALWAAFRSLQGEAVAALGSRNYPLFYSLAVGLKAPVDAFLDKIMVMVEDPAVRANRLALLQEVAGLLSGPADLAKLVI